MAYRTQNKTNKDLLKEAKEEYPGWAEIIETLDKLISIADSDYQIIQIKEKFGGLRYYTWNSNKYNAEVGNKFPAFSDPISIFKSDAERKSFNTCENCGKNKWDANNLETRPNKGGCWILTLCEDCRKESGGE